MDARTANFVKYSILPTLIGHQASGRSGQDARKHHSRHRKRPGESNDRFGFKQADRCARKPRQGHRVRRFASRLPVTFPAKSFLAVSRGRDSSGFREPVREKAEEPETLGRRVPAQGKKNDMHVKGDRRCHPPGGCLSHRRVAEPDRAILEPLAAFQAQGRRLAVQIGDAVEDCRLSFPAVDARRDHHAELVDQSGFEEGSVDPKSVIRLWGDCPLVSCSMLLA